MAAATLGATGVTNASQAAAQVSKTWDALVLATARERVGAKVAEVRADQENEVEEVAGSLPSRRSSGNHHIHLHQNHIARVSRRGHSGSMSQRHHKSQRTGRG